MSIVDRNNNSLTPGGVNCACSWLDDLLACVNEPRLDVAHVNVLAVPGTSLFHCGGDALMSACNAGISVANGEHDALVVVANECECRH